MKIKFDENQQYQLDAISAVVDLFKGQQPASGAFEFSLKNDDLLSSELGLGTRTANALVRSLKSELSSFILVKVGASSLSPESGIRLQAGTAI
jgi:restriction endonuclease